MSHAPDDAGQPLLWSYDAEPEMSTYPQDKKVLVTDNKDTKAFDHADSTDGPGELQEDFDPAVVKRIVRKYDTHILPCLVAMYYLNYLDRQNVAAARLKGLQTDLSLSGLQYSNCINLFFVTYIALQVPATYGFATVSKPTYYICTFMVLWGMVSLLTAEAKGYGSLLAIRLVLGLCEAVFYPGALLVLTRFYTRNELALRSGFFYGSALVASGTGALLATGIIDGIGKERNGKAGWRYLFYIEGAITIGAACVIVFVLPNFPGTAPFLTAEEKRIAVLRLRQDVGTADVDDQSEKWYQPFQQAFTDPLLWLLCLVWWLTTAGLAFNSYSPTLTASLGLGGSTVSLLLTAPPYFLALAVELVNCYHSDKTADRSIHTIWPLCVACAGCIIPLATTQKAARYVGIFAMTLAYGGYPVILGWVNVSFPGRPKRRAAGIAFAAAFANTANIAGGYFFVSSKYGPEYRTSFALVLAMFAAAIMAAVATRFYTKWVNKHMDNGTTHLLPGFVRPTIEALPQGFRYFT